MIPPTAQSLICRGLPYNYDKNQTGITSSRNKTGIIVNSLKNFSSGFVALFLLLDPVIVAILAWIIFSESLSFFNVLGFALILEGIYLAKTGKGADQMSGDLDKL